MTRMRRGAGNVGFILVAVLLFAAEPRAAAAHTHAEGPAAQDARSTYRRPLRFDPATLDPARIADIYSRSVAQQLFDGLVQYDQTLTVVPALARFWRSSRDGLEWTFHLRQGVKFHHGREVTADDVVYSLTRLLDPRIASGAADAFQPIKGAREYREGRARHVSGLTAPDRYTVRVVLEEAFAPFVNTLAVGHAKIVPRDVVETAGAGFGMNPVGTGPFRLVRWERGKKLVLAANANYFDGPPRLERVVFRIFPGKRFDTVFEEFRQGHLEDTPIPTWVSTEEYRRIIRDPAFVHVKRSMFTLRFYGFNTRVKPLDDVRVRQAVVHAIDRERIVEELYLGRFAQARGILPPGTLGYNPQLTGYAYDPARARALLAEAGYPEGAGLPPIEIWAGLNDERTLREHQAIGVMLAAVGIRAAFKYQTDWIRFSRDLAAGQYPVFLYAWYADTPDPDNFLSRLFHSLSPRNFFGYRSAAVDALVVRARAEPHLPQRAELYRRAEHIVLADAPLLPVWHYTYERAFQPYVRSVEVNGLGDPYIPLRKIWLDRP